MEMNEVLNLEDEIVKVKYQNVVYDVRVPSVTAMRDYEAKIDVEANDKIEELYDLLSEHGLPKEVLRKMNFNHLRKIQESFVPKK